MKVSIVSLMWDYSSVVEYIPMLEGKLQHQKEKKKAERMNTKPVAIVTSFPRQEGER